MRADETPQRGEYDNETHHSLDVGNSFGRRPVLWSGERSGAGAFAQPTFDEQAGH
jgi:hypothetical protein